MTRIASPADLFVIALAAVAFIGCNDMRSTSTTASTGVFVTPAVIAQSTPTLPVSGGTLLASHDQRILIASDPNLDSVWLVQPRAGTDRGGTTRVQLNTGDEPGRAVEDDSGHVHVLLRSGGGIATIDLHTGSLTRRSAVCPAPRGIAYDAGRGTLFVACADGELARVSPSSGEIFDVRWLPDDLRDVVVDHDALLISRFRSAQVLVVNPDAPDVPPRVLTPPTFTRLAISDAIQGGVFEPEVAWRMVPDPRGGAFMVYQRKSVIAADLEAPHASAAPSAHVASGYGVDSPPVTAPCGGDIIHTAVSHVDATRGIDASPALPSLAALPVDVAIAPDGLRFAIASALGRDLVSSGGVAFASTDQLGLPQCAESVLRRNISGRAVAVMFMQDGSMAFQTMAPSTIDVVSNTGSVTTYALGASLPEDTGAALFHDALASRSGARTTGAIACASCHPEGSDDGQVWSFGGAPRRTQSLSGGILDDAPFHWDGHLATFADLLGETMPTRMGSAVPDDAGTEALALWVDRIRRPAAASVVDADAASRGEALFRDPNVACSSCHAGARLSTHALMDVGTGGAFKVPALVAVAARGPWMHNGCARTLAERFDPACGGGDRHGHTSQLSPAQIADLVAYLRSL